MAIFGESITLSSVTVGTNGTISVTVSKANAINNVYVVVGSGGYVVEPTSFSGKSVTLTVYVMPATATAGPLVPATSGTTIPSITIGIVYEGY